MIYSKWYMYLWYPHFFAQVGSYRSDGTWCFSNIGGVSTKKYFFLCSHQRPTSSQCGPKRWTTPGLPSCTTQCQPLGLWDPESASAIKRAAVFSPGAKSSGKTWPAWPIVTTTKDVRSWPAKKKETPGRQGASWKMSVRWFDNYSNLSWIYLDEPSICLFFEEIAAVCCCNPAHVMRKLEPGYMAATQSSLKSHNRWMAVRPKHVVWASSTHFAGQTIPMLGDGLRNFWLLQPLQLLHTVS